MDMPWKDPRVQRGMDALLKLRDAHVRAGGKVVGWKIAFGPKAVREKLGIGAPLVGFLTREQTVESGTTVSLDGWQRPVLEPEIAVYLAHDLAPGSNAEAGRNAIGKLAPAFELIDSPRPPEDPEPVLAGNIAHRYAVLGPAGMADATLMTGAVYRNGAECARTDDVQALPGELGALLAHVADYLDAFGQKLRAGEVVICGSIVAPIPVEAGDNEFHYRLDPLGDVSVRFARGGA